MFCKLSIAALVALPLLHGCGNSSNSGDSGSSNVRLVNATNATDYPSLDLVSSTTSVSSGVKPFTAGSYGSVGAGTQMLTLKSITPGSPASTASYTLNGGTQYTFVAYIAPTGILSGVLLADSGDVSAAPTAGTAKFRVYNTVSFTPTGAVTPSERLDVYVVPATADCSALSAGALASKVNKLSAYSEVAASSAGTTYRVCVTGEDERSDLRLDLPDLKLKDQQITTLVLTASPGGVLVNGVQIDQQGEVTARSNPSARIRVVADAAGRGKVTAVVNGSTLADKLASPLVDGYRRVPAGSLATSARIDDGPVAARSFTAAPGADLTLLVAGPASAPTVKLLDDNNRPSQSATAPARLRLVNGVNDASGLAGGVSLLLNAGGVASDVKFGEASAPANVPVTPATAIQIVASSPVAFDGTALTLLGGSVYTLFVLGDAPSPVGLLRRDR